ncbi:transgelin-3 [Octopus bimaculoides]|uniref:Calponin-homology (CH) domain-containing protein n=1 Tax=Octopus bimaculoides TaxID=37653 RepID=A0A0L8ICE8_OCTBM|nr:transgelin-3 [Octopus bimaculoides]|eukprot:XP_014777580.1 PREDICTED: transgelin-3-like [Octopus bimaculoides]
MSRAKKAGLGAEIERKMEQRYDKEEEAGTPAAVVSWINGLFEGTSNPTCPGSSMQQIHSYLQDGTNLCRLINRLLEAEGKPAINFSKNVRSPFIAMGNIETFSKTCESYGLNKEALFQSNDLTEGKKGPFLNVINCLHSLGFLANSKMVLPAYTGQQTKYMEDD